MALVIIAACSAPVPTAPAPGPAHSATESFAVIAGLRVEADNRDAQGRAIPNERGSAAVAWLGRELVQAQSFPSLALASPAPQFALVCGDLTESGALGNSWSNVERLLDSIGVEWFAAAGDQDMSVAPLFEGFGKRFGGLVYSFNRGSAHFIALCTASPTQQLPCFSPLQLSWLRADLASNADRRPVFVFLHHAPHSGELAPAQALELQAALDGHEIAAVFFGQGTGVESRRVGNLDCIFSGAAVIEDTPVADASGEADARGYALAMLNADRLRVVFRPFDERLEPRLLLEKPLRPKVRAPLVIEAPVNGAPARGEHLEISVRSAQSAPLSLQLDGEPRSLQWIRDGEHSRARLPLSGLAGGVHQIAVTRDDEGTKRIATGDFIAPSEQVKMLWRRTFSGSLRAAPVFAGEWLAVASTAGEIAVLDRHSGELRWSAKTAAVLGSPLGLEDGGLIVATTAGWVEAYAAAGSLRWRFAMGKPALADLAGAGALVFASDSEGTVHALDIASGARRWKFGGAHGPIMARPVVDQGRLLFAAADGRVRALDSESGELLWQSAALTAPMGAGVLPSTLAHGTPVVTGSSVWVVHAGVLSRLSSDGKRTDFDFRGIVSVGASEDGVALNLRAQDDRYYRLDTEGKLLGSQSVSLGRVASPPRESAGRLAVVSDRGKVNCLDSATLETLWTWRATADSYVFAAPLLAHDGTVWVAGMDGSLSAIRAR